VMNPYMKNENLHSDVIDQFIQLGVKGGQMSSGAQKDGFLKYEKNMPAAAYDSEKKEYVAFDAALIEKCNAKLGSLPSSYKPWKAVNFNKKKLDILATYFTELKPMDTFGANLAKAYLKNSKEIGMKLVNTNVAKEAADVNTVLLTGFYHSYGPINEYI